MSTPGPSPNPALSAPATPPSGSTGPGKTREDYLLSYQDRLLQVVDDSCKSVNRLLAISYGMALLVALVFWQGVNELSVFGVKLPLNPHQIPLIVPLLLLGTSLLLSHELLRTQKALSESRNTSDAITTINPEAMPPTLEKVGLFIPGVVGLLLSIARWQTKVIVDHNPFRRWDGANVLPWLYGMIQWFLGSLVRLFLVLCIFIGPLALSAYYVNRERMVHPSVMIAFAYAALTIAALATIVCGTLVFVSYSVDYVMGLKKDFEDLVGDLAEYLRSMQLVLQVLSRFLAR